MCERFASPPIRNAGTMGGNVANGSPIGDSMPGLIALGATVTLAQSRALADAADGRPLRRLHEEGDGGGRVCRGDRSAVCRAPSLRFRTYKVSKRFDSDISAVCAAFAIELDGEPDRRAAAWRSAASRPRRSARAPPSARSRGPMERGDGARRHGGARRRLHAAHRHAGERGLSPADGAEPAVSILPRDAPRPARCRRPRSACSRWRSESRESRMNRQAEGFMARHDALPAAGAPHPHESAHLHVAGEATYVDDIPEIAGTLHAALGLSEKAHARIRSIDLSAVRAAPGVVAVLTAADIPGENDCGPIVHDDPILADGLVQYVGQPMFVVVADDQPAARRAARLAKVDYEVLPPVLTPQEAKRQQVVRAAADAPDARRPERRHGRCAAPDAGRVLRRRPGAVLPRGADLLRGAEGGRLPPPLLLDAASDRDAARRRARARSRREPGDRGDAADGRRLRRQGVAIGALRLRGGGGGASAARPGQDPARSRRRLPGHGQAPLLSLRVRGRLRRRRDDPRREDRDDGARRLLGRPVGAGVHARRLPLRQCVLPARRRHPRARRQDQHAVEHRVPRLRRPAGRDRDRVPDRQHRARARDAIRSTCARRTSTARASATSRPTG